MGKVYVILIIGILFSIILIIPFILAAQITLNDFYINGSLCEEGHPSGTLTIIPIDNKNNQVQIDGLKTSFNLNVSANLLYSLSKKTYVLNILNITEDFSNSPNLTVDFKANQSNYLFTKQANFSLEKCINQERTQEKLYKTDTFIKRNIIKIFTGILLIFLIIFTFIVLRREQ